MAAQDSHEKLTPENFRQGFLMDEELMGGVTDHPDAEQAQAGRYLGFVLRHTTGEYLGYAAYSSLEEALEALNRIPREWKFEKSSGCGEGACGQGGACQGKNCSLYRTENCAKNC